MAKTLSQFMTEVAQPKSDDEKAFKEKHATVKHDDANGNGDDVFKATNVKKDKTKKSSYEGDESEAVYENADVVAMLRQLLEDMDETADDYVDLYQNTYARFNEINRQRLDEMIKSGNVDKVLYFLEAVNY